MPRGWWRCRRWVERLARYLRAQRRGALAVVGLTEVLDVIRKTLLVFAYYALTAGLIGFVVIKSWVCSHRANPLHKCLVIQAIEFGKTGRV